MKNLQKSEVEMLNPEMLNPEMVALAKRIMVIWTKAVDSLYEGCKIYVKALEKYPEMTRYMIGLGANGAHLRRFEEVGRGKLHPQLTFKSGDCYKRLSKCPLSEQHRALTGPIEFLHKSGEVQNVNISEMSKEQIEQVFAYDHIRDIAAQKNYQLKIQAIASSKAPTYKKPYTVYKDYVVINGVKFYKKDLLNILGEMK